MDYPHSDVAAGISLNWIEKPQDQWKKYVPREQDGSLSCCGQGSAKAYETIKGTVMSAHPIYRRRANYPSGGMWLQDVGDIWKKHGTTTELIDPSQFKNETEMNKDVSVDTPATAGGYIFCNPKNIEEIAEAVFLHKHCILIFHANHGEWKAVPVYDPNLFVDFGHCVCAVDFFMYQGKKAILIEDSTGHFSSILPEKDGRRIITEDYLKARCDGAMYLVPKLESIPYEFTKILRVGSKGIDVKMLQLALKKDGYTITADGIFGNITKLTVTSFQHKHGLTADGIVGKRTNAVLNMLNP